MLEAVILDMDSTLFKSKSYPPIPYVADLVKDLSQNRIGVAITSSFTLEDILSITKKIGIENFVDVIISENMVKNINPSTDILSYTLLKLKVKKENTLVIGDSSNSIAASKKAGIKCIGFINSDSEKQDLSSAIVLIESFKDIDTRFLTNEYKRAYGIPVEITKTQHLYIQEMTIEDIKELYEIYENLEVTKYIEPLDKNISQELEKHKAYIENIYNFYGYGLWGVYLKKNKKLIGRAGIQNRIIDHQSEIELGYVLNYEYWAKGFGFECCHAILAYAFEYLGIDRIVASIHKDNIRSITLVKKLGFLFEKEIIDNNHSCNLYAINKELFTKQERLRNKRILATKQVTEKFAKGIDTQVYSKRYRHKKNEE